LACIGDLHRVEFYNEVLDGHTMFGANPLIACSPSVHLVSPLPPHLQCWEDIYRITRNTFVKRTEAVGCASLVVGCVSFGVGDYVGSQWYCAVVLPATAEFHGKAQ